MTAIARRAGVNVQMEKIERELQSNDSYMNSPLCRRYFKVMFTLLCNLPTTKFEFRKLFAFFLIFISFIFRLNYYRR